VGRVEVNQVYAKFQHESLDLKHPHGGHARFLANPLMRDHLFYMQLLADDAIDNGGRRAMVFAMENLSDHVETEAPIWFSDLRRSGHPSVTDDGMTYYDRAPIQHRLTEEEIEAKKDLDPSGWITLHGDHIYVGKKEGS
jgi:hypothetical protein